MTTPLDARPRDVKAALDAGQCLLIDVREPWEYQQKHIPGAQLIPLADIPEKVDELPADIDIYVHCRLGGRSGRAVEYLREQGRPRAINMLGGIEAWEDSGLPVA